MCSNKIPLQGALFLTLFCVSGITATSVQMRVVKELANYGYFGPNPGENEINQPVSNVPPANFSGPPLLRRLIGKCFNFTQEQYRYTFCPFQNFTQFELSSRWNAYHGILGIWSHWNITNNTFHAMVYTHGDRCGDIERKVHVHLQCGSLENLTNVSEPSRCQYRAVFLTRYVCHNDSLLVYPRLPSGLQRKWDQLLTELHNGDITEKINRQQACFECIVESAKKETFARCTHCKKFFCFAQKEQCVKNGLSSMYFSGYYYGLEKIFHSVGLSENTVSILPEEKVTTESAIQLGTLFTDLPTCNKEYKNIAKEIARLNQEIDALKLLLDLSKIENRTTKPHQ